MALEGDIREIAVSATGRTVIMAGSNPRQADYTVEVWTPAGTSFGGSTVSLEAADKVSPAVATADDWSILEGLDSLAVGTRYRVITRANVLAVNCVGGAPTFTLRVK
jgi:hypothetical protein